MDSILSLWIWKDSAAEVLMCNKKHKKIVVEKHKSIKRAARECLGYMRSGKLVVTWK